ncbi:hypothetical protein T492DRAFT_902500 [Pavlovales sp. CCMP2436]|nr:hypothetical protein T492DRAFT_902500 [Pavlovales sp. CCMP2436]
MPCMKPSVGVCEAVDLRRLDDVLADPDLGIRSVNVVKMDIEGAEFDEAELTPIIGRYVVPRGEPPAAHLEEGSEMKTVHYGLTHYNAVAPTRGHAVEIRSGKLDAERRRQLQQTDPVVFRTREGRQSKSLDNLLKNFAGMGAETWMGKLSTPTTMQARNTLLGLMRKEFGVIVARGHARLILACPRCAAAGARGAPWFQRTGRSANGPEDAPAHADGAYRDDNWRSHNADRGARLGCGGRGGRGRQGTRT